MSATAPVLRSDRGVRRWLPYVLGAVAFLFTLGVVGAAVGDSVARNIEMRNLLTRIEASEAAMTTFQGEFDAITSKAASGGGQLTQEQTAQVAADLKDLAARSHDSIAKAGDGVAAVRWLIWHPEIGRAQEAYLAHNRAWQAYMQRAAADPQEFFKAQDEVNSTFEAAQKPMERAVPVIDLMGLGKRVAAIFAPPPGSGGQAA